MRTAINSTIYTRVYLPETFIIPIRDNENTDVYS